LTVFWPSARVAFTPCTWVASAASLPRPDSAWSNTRLRAQREIGRHLPLRRQRAGGVDLGVDVGLREVAEIGRVEAAGDGVGLERLLVQQVQVAADAHAALAGRQARLAHVSTLLFSAASATRRMPASTG
jgi:hypothetical protein